MRAMPWPERVAIWMLAAITLVALMGPLLAPYDPLVRVADAYGAPSLAHPFGTDEIGRDLLSRVVLGVRLTWLPGLAIILMSLLVGALVGTLAGALGGWVDTALVWVTDLFLVLPSTLIALAVVAALGPGLANTVLAIVIFWWPWYARMTRAEVAAQVARPHVEAARLAGVSGPRLLWRYLLPGAFPTLLVASTLDVANVVLVLSLFSFLGLGLPAPAPELGAMTARTLDNLTVQPWLPLMPAAAVFLLCLSANLAGDGLRSALRGA